MLNSTLCYIEKDGKYLMLHRVKKENDLNRDMWIGVGGKMEEGESPLDCVIRETFEETGLALDEPKYRGLVTFCFSDGEKALTEQMHLFTCEKFSGSLSGDCREGELEWVPKDRVLSLPIWEGDKIFLELLNKEKRFFLLKLEYDGDRLVGHRLDFAGG